MMSDIEPLPKSWVLSKIDELSDIVRGITFPASAKENQKTSSNICCLRTSNVQKNLEWQDIYFVDKKFVKREEQELRKDDILMSMANSYELVGKVCTANELPQEATFGAFLTALRPADSIDPRYFYYFLNSSAVQKKLRGNSSQTTNIANISVKSLKAIEIVIAPLNEQRRIANKLDTTLAAVEACKQKLNNAAVTIQHFRQSVLAAVVSGELTREWRVERGIEGEWEVQQLQALLDEPMRNGKSVRDGNQTKVLRLSCLGHDFINTKDNKSGDWTGINPESFLIKEGDFLIARGNGSINLVGRGRLVPETKEEIAFPDTMIRIRPDKNKIRPDYLALLWESAPIRKQLELGARTSAGIWKISQGDLNCIKIKIPTLAEQDLICLRAREHLSAAQNSKDKIQDTSKILELLSKALLAKAFRGELVPQDPNDEPASALLERIKAQRQAEAATKKPAKRGRKKKADSAQLAIPAGIAENHLAKVLEECGALSELALIAASELEPRVFQLQLSKELNAGGLKQVDKGGEAAYADAAWEEEL